MRGRYLLAPVIGGALLAGLAAAGSASETKTYTYDALGRLTKAQSTGTVNSLDTNSLCYDAAGNRTAFKSDGNGAVVTCGTGGSGNNPPVANADTIQVGCNVTLTYNVTANDTDPEGQALTLVSAVSDGDASVSVVSASSVQVTGSWTNETASGSYVVKDSQNATATGNLTIKSVGGPSICG